MTDIIDSLVGQVVKARHERIQARENAQASFQALLEPADDSAFSVAERYAVAAFVAGLHEESYDFYLDLLEDEAGHWVEPVRTAVREDRSDHIADQRLRSALEIAQLLVFNPAQSTPETIGYLYASGWNADGVVSLSQLVSFLAFQLRVITGLKVLSGQEVNRERNHLPVIRQKNWTEHPEVMTYPNAVRPAGFVNHALGWKPWLKPVEKKALNQQQLDALIKPERADMPYFRLLARDPATLHARTLTDLDIFYNTEGGLSRADRELAATVASRFNGCEYCASVHQARAKEEGGDAKLIDALLDEGVEVDLGRKWNQIRDIALKLTRIPWSLEAKDLEGLSELEALDAIYAASFFNWANRLMLFLGQPEVPARFRP